MQLVRERRQSMWRGERRGHLCTHQRGMELMEITAQCEHCVTEVKMERTLAVSRRVDSWLSVPARVVPLPIVLASLLLATVLHRFKEDTPKKFQGSESQEFRIYFFFINNSPVRAKNSSPTANVLGRRG